MKKFIDFIEDRDYKDEYNKFQSSTKMKRYRAELNRYNRKKGTYGNGDGKDASHKNGKIVGYEDENALEFAEAWGIFMQLTNILRDVSEDFERNRIYLPLDELKRHGIKPEELGEALSDDLRWKAFTSDFIGRAESYYFRAQRLLPLLERNTRYSPAAMMAFYHSVLKKIKKRDGDVFHGTVKLSKAEKLTMAALVYAKQRFLRL